MMHLLAVASGSRGMAGGQAIDLAAVGQQLTSASWNSCTSTRPAR
jgi:hypothetical protein